MYTSMISWKGVRGPLSDDINVLKEEWEKVKDCTDWERKFYWIPSTDQKLLNDLLDKMGMHYMKMEELIEILNLQMLSLSNDDYEIDMEDVLASLKIQDI